jgi:endonuclease/exonuclease/phosphatase (EEP) superfamily protein YafD
MSGIREERSLDPIDRTEGAVLDEPHARVETAGAVGAGRAADAVRPSSALGRARHLAGRVTVVCSWLYLLSALALWALLLGADVWWPATLFLFSPRWLAAVPLLALAPVAAVLQRRALAPLLAGFVVVAGPVMGFCVPWQRLLASAPEGQHFRLLTCNMHYHTEGSVPLERLVATARPDIVLLQEWRGSEESPAFSAGGWHTHDVQGLFLASAYPVRRATQFGDNSTGEKGLIMRYELDTPAGLLNVFSVHLASPRAGLAKMIHERGTSPGGLEAETQLRWRQSRYLVRLAEKVSGPVILAGDFNTPPESAIFRDLWNSYSDAFGSAGWGWGYTFKGARTMVRIDHILTSPAWYCDSCWVGSNIGSPHRPVLADLTVTR